MGRSLLAMLFVGLLMAVPRTNASAADSTSCTDANLTCWAKALQAGKSVMVRLEGPVDPSGISKDGKPPSDDDLKTFKEARDRGGKLIVWVTGQARTGAGGTLLLVLAADTDRFVGPDAELTRLDDTTHTLLERFGACDPLCKKNRESKEGVQGRQLIEAKLARAIDSDITIGTKNGGGDRADGPGVSAPAASGPGGTKKADDTDDSRWLLTVTGGGLLALLAILGVLIVRSGKRWEPATGLPGTGPPRPSPAPRPEIPPGRPAMAARRRKPVSVPSGPPRSATVRTGLHPQGYVELGRCLYRATWADPREPTPALGEVVDVFEADARTGTEPGVLLAFPHDAGR
ncbi:hypothetical protein [Streptomyces triculaminicus]|uniref:hypothetical protein n=1 Tax=Streptomyces triculaminicus TaxID=2816232 RepID=UPI00378AE86D